MKKDMSDAIASAMDATLKDPEFKSIFSTSAVLEKLAFKRVADEELPTEVEIEFSNELSQEPLESTASDSARADCIACGKKRSGWTEAMGVCKCSAENGCNPMVGCKDGCSCDCKAKKAGVAMSDYLVKSAFDSLMKASATLEEAGFETLSAHALILTSELIVEAKAKKDKKDDKKAKEKEKADKEKAKAKAEKDKNAAKDKAMKDKEKAAKEKAKAKAQAEKEKADKAKKSGK